MVTINADLVLETSRRLVAERDVRRPQELIEQKPL
jgi:hypothetical protein